MLYSSRLLWQVIVFAFIFLLETFFPLFNQKKDRYPHATRNLSFGLINGVLGAFFFAWVTVHVLDWIQKREIGLLCFFDLHPLLELGIAFVLFDLWMYGWHRLNHKAPFLWRFHRVHHSDTQMDSTTAFLFHFGEIFLSFITRIFVLVLLGLSWKHLLIYELFLQPVILFHHSNINLPEKVDRIFRSLIVTPNMHRVHHSKIKKETDSNFSSIFSVWDRLGRTFIKREDIPLIQYGLETNRAPEQQKFINFFKMPFRNE